MCSARPTIASWLMVASSYEDWPKSGTHANHLPDGLESNTTQYTQYTMAISVCVSLIALRSRRTPSRRIRPHNSRKLDTSLHTTTAHGIPTMVALSGIGSRGTGRYDCDESVNGYIWTVAQAILSKPSVVLSVDTHLDVSASSLRTRNEKSCRAGLMPFAYSFVFI